MSRVAKKPIVLTKGVELNIQTDNVSVKGPKGTLTIAKPAGIEVIVEDGHALLSANDPALIPLAGTLRAIIANMVQGVSEGFQRKLELVGVGYRASMTGQDLTLALGFSHPVIVEPPAGITFVVEGPRVHVQGTDKEHVGQVAANIRKLRPPEPYKGKGIRYSGERVRRKAGKSGKVGK